MQGIFRKENTDKALKYGIYRHLPTYEKIIRNLVSFYIKKSIRKAANDINKISGLDTNALITTTNGNLELRELLQEVNEMMLTFRKLEIDIEKKNNSLQKTIVNISHDLKTPLTSALAMSNCCKNMS